MLPDEVHLGIVSHSVAHLSDLVSMSTMLLHHHVAGCVGSRVVTDNTPMSLTSWDQLAVICDYAP